MPSFEEEEEEEEEEFHTMWKMSMGLRHSSLPLGGRCAGSFTCPMKSSAKIWSLNFIGQEKLLAHLKWSPRECFPL